LGLQSIIYYALRAEKLEDWLQLDTISAALKPTLEKHYAELDPVFNGNIDEDYDHAVSGITRSSFCSVYLSWIHFCILKREKVRIWDLYKYKTECFYTLRADQLLELALT